MDKRSRDAIFKFEFDPMAHLSISLGYELDLTWSQVSGPSSGVIEAANCRNYNRTNALLERIGLAGTYRLRVPIHLLGEGRLLVKLNISISCINFNNRYRYSRSRCGCLEWQIRGTSDLLEISAKRGW